MDPNSNVSDHFEKALDSLHPATCPYLRIAPAYVLLMTPSLQVPNVIPSISSVVGGVTPERYIWRLGMAFFSFPRLFDSFLYYNFLSQGPGNRSFLRYWGNWLLLLLHWVQYLSLFGLSYVSSKENYSELVDFLLRDDVCNILFSPVVHRNCFIGFIVCSIVHMLLFLFLFKAARKPATYRVRPNDLMLNQSSQFAYLFIFRTRYHFVCEWLLPQLTLSSSS